MRFFLGLLCIQNYNVPICKNCKYFIPYRIDESFIILSKCKKFGKLDILSGEFKYDYADICRRSSSKCGINGVFFVPKENNNNNNTNNSV